MATCVTVGFFDGVHRGHQYLIRTLQKVAIRYGLLPIVLTFEQILKRGSDFSDGQFLIDTPLEKRELLQSYCRTMSEPQPEVHYLDFVRVGHMKAEEYMLYVQKVFDTRCILMGYDHRFGSDLMDNFHEYEACAVKLGIEVTRASSFRLNGREVSSSKIRECLKEGAMEQVTEMLGRPFKICGVVVRGRGIGRQIDFPTANVCVDSFKLLPRDGVYKSVVKLEHRTVTMSAIVNIGNNPTIAKDNLRTVEVHIPGYCGDLYGQAIEVDLIHFLREERFFTSVDQLRHQIQRDVECL